MELSRRYIAIGRRLEGQRPAVSREDKALVNSDVGVRIEEDGGTANIVVKGEQVVGQIPEASDA